MTAPRPIIIDTDPGQDDAVAILLALASPELELRAITTVAGNVPVDLTTLNARKICDLAGRRDIPVHRGADRPIVRPLRTAEHVHGRTGLDGPDLPDPITPEQSRHAVDVLIGMLMDAPAGEITLVALGPLTNIALALAREPRIAGRIREIALMGGGYFEGGNITPSAEFNIFVDPHAADIVFRSGVPVAMFPLDVTHKVLTTTARMERIAAIDTEAARAVVALTAFFERFDEAKYGSDGAPLHDPCPVAWLIRPELFSGRHVNVEVEISSELTMGATVVDWWRVTKRPVNAQVLRDVDAEGFFALLTERLARL